MISMTDLLLYVLQDACRWRNAMPVALLASVDIDVCDARLALDVTTPHEFAVAALHVSHHLELKQGLFNVLFFTIHITDIYSSRVREINASCTSPYTSPYFHFKGQKEASSRATNGRSPTCVL